jgi:hypothetical protein
LPRRAFKIEIKVMEISCLDESNSADFIAAEHLEKTCLINLSFSYSHANTTPPNFQIHNNAVLPRQFDNHPNHHEFARLHAAFAVFGSNAKRCALTLLNPILSDDHDRQIIDHQI